MREAAAREVVPAEATAEEGREAVLAVAMAEAAKAAAAMKEVVEWVVAGLAEAAA